MTHYSELTKMIEEEIGDERVQNLADVLFAEYKTETMPEFVNTGLKVGDIWVSSWGYDQTNIDFYQVVKVTPKTVTVQEIKSTSAVVTGRFSEQVVPSVGNFVKNAKPIRRTVRRYYNQLAISINSFASAYPWDGMPKTETSYA